MLFEKAENDGMKRHRIVEGDGKRENDSRGSVFEFDGPVSNLFPVHHPSIVAAISKQRNAFEPIPQSADETGGKQTAILGLVA